MVPFIRATWLPTLVFAVLSRFCSDLGSGILRYLGPTVVALLLMPPLWAGFVLRRGHPGRRRAALTGASVSVLIVLLTTTMGEAWQEAHLKTVDGFGAGVGNLVFVLFSVFVVLVGGPVGAGLALLLASVHIRRGHQPSTEAARARPSIRDGAIAGAMIAVLAGPFSTIIAAWIVPKILLPRLPGGILSCCSMLLETWLILIPAAALIGARGVRRWNRLPDPQLQPRTL